MPDGFSLHVMGFIFGAMTIAVKIVAARLALQENETMQPARIVKYHRQ
jgi:hypothetical protein